MVNDTVRFEKRIQYLFLAILIGAIFIGLVGVLGFNRISQTMNALLYDHAQDVMDLQQLRLTLEKKVAHSRGFLLSSSPEFMESSIQEHENFKRLLTLLRGDIASPKGQMFLDQIEAGELAHQRAVEQAMRFKEAGATYQQIVEYWLTRVRPNHAAIENIFEQAILYEENQFEVATKNALEERTTIYYLILASVMSAALFGLGLFWFITRTVNEIGHLFREREQTEESLRQAFKTASDFKYSLDQASIFATTDKNGVITYVNDMFCKISQYSRQELIGNTHRMLNSGYHSKDFFKNLWGTISQGKIWRGEIKNRAKDGSYYWVDTFIIPFLDDNGKPYQYTAIRNDITYRKVAEEKLQRTQLQLQAIIDSASSIIYLKDLKGNLIFINRNFERFFKVSRGSVIGKNIYTVMDPKVSKVLNAPDQMVLSKGGAEQTDEKLNLDGITRTFLTTTFPVRDEQKNTYAIGGMLTDITEREESAQALKLALQSRDDFISVASHELKTPLSSLKLQYQMLKRRIEKGDTEILRPESLVNIAEQTDLHIERLVRLVDDMLDIARIRSGRLSIHQERLNLKYLIQQVVKRTMPQLKSLGIEIRCDLSQDIWGHWDRMRIEQVISNLLTNAIKYGEKRPILIKLTEKNHQAIICIQDWGIGISKDSQQRIFDRFERAISSSEVSGLGLGLFISKELVQAHHGQIFVESEVGRGATFKVILPITNLYNSTELPTSLS
jgi:PAS domain S-box-containing protein